MRHNEPGRHEGWTGEIKPQGFFLGMFNFNTYCRTFKEVTAETAAGGSSVRQWRTDGALQMKKPRLQKRKSDFVFYFFIFYLHNSLIKAWEVTATSFLIQVPHIENSKDQGWVTCRETRLPGFNTSQFPSATSSCQLESMAAPDASLLMFEGLKQQTCSCLFALDMQVLFTSFRCYYNMWFRLFSDPEVETAAGL